MSKPIYQSKPHAVVVDANNFIAMAAHANAELKSAENEPTGGIYGMLRMLKTLLTQDLDCEAEAVYFVFDAGRPAFRSEVCKTYKSNRGEDSRGDDFYAVYKEQVRKAPRLLRPLGVHCVRAGGFEADDLIAGLVWESGLHKRWIVVSGDKDLRQLRGDRVRLFLPSKHDFVVDDDCPPGYLLMRCLTGDKSDCIPGVGGLGDVRAAEVIKELGDGPFTPKALRQWALANPKHKYAPKVLEKRSVIRDNWKVMNLRRTAADAFAAMEMSKGEGSEARFIKRCKRYSFRSIVRDVFAYRRIIRSLSRGK